MTLLVVDVPSKPNQKSSTNHRTTTTGVCVVQHLLNKGHYVKVLVSSKSALLQRLEAPHWATPQSPKGNGKATNDDQKISLMTVTEATFRGRLIIIESLAGWKNLTDDQWWTHMRDVTMVLSCLGDVDNFQDEMIEDNHRNDSEEKKPKDHSLCESTKLITMALIKRSKHAGMNQAPKFMAILPPPPSATDKNEAEKEEFVTAFSPSNKDERDHQSSSLFFCCPFFWSTPDAALPLATPVILSDTISTMQCLQQQARGSSNIQNTEDESSWSPILEWVVIRPCQWEVEYEDSINIDAAATTHNPYELGIWDAALTQTSRNMKINSKNNKNNSKRNLETVSMLPDAAMANSTTEGGVTRTQMAVVLVDLITNKKGLWDQYKNGNGCNCTVDSPSIKTPPPESSSTFKTRILPRVALVRPAPFD